ncbi:cytochrome c biogenesis factor [Mucilaginibacter sp. OAE612]
MSDILTGIIAILVIFYFVLFSIFYPVSNPLIIYFKESIVNSYFFNLFIPFGQ